MSKRSINGNDLIHLMTIGAAFLEKEVERVNALNVFPVPDGDTGTNMNLTMRSGMNELRSRPSASLGKSAEALSKGLLMGARGNSGVILSQLFRGLARGFANLDEAGPMQVASALQHGVDTAYKSVVKPVEGTILTVAREAAKHAVMIARRTPDVGTLMREVLTKANETLQRTPDMLPILKQVGVVDSGGQGLVLIYEGMVHALFGETAGWEQSLPVLSTGAAKPSSARSQSNSPSKAQSKLATESIEFLYDMEFFINRTADRVPGMRFDENWFKRALAKDGDSIIVISDDELIKVHVHTRKPGDVLNLALPYGELTNIQILNMRDQHRELLEQGGAVDEAYSTEEEPFPAPVYAEARELEPAAVLTGGAPVRGVSPESVHEVAPYGIIAVALGNGITSIFEEYEADIVLSGGQTMNPSTEDFLHAIESLSAAHIFLLPNNSNIILAAQQAAEMTERSVTVIPTKTIPQGIAALLSFSDSEPVERNCERMAQAAAGVLSGQVTLAVRDTVMDGITIREGDYIGIAEKEIVASTASLQEACRMLIGHLMQNNGDIITLLTGSDAAEEDTEAIAEWIRETYPSVELEVHQGGQPLYPYLIAVE